MTSRSCPLQSLGGMEAAEVKPLDGYEALKSWLPFLPILPAWVLPVFSFAHSTSSSTFAFPFLACLPLFSHLNPILFHPIPSYSLRPITKLAFASQSSPEKLQFTENSF